MKNKILIFLFLLIPLQANANLILNGDFESGTFIATPQSGGFGNFVNLNSGLPNWIISRNIDVWLDFNGTGNRVLDLLGNSVSTNGTIRQSFATIPGTVYSLSFDVGGSNNPTPSFFNSPVKTMDVTLFSSTSDIIRNVNFAEDTSTFAVGTLLPRSFTFTATDALTTLQFRGTNGGFNGFYLDNIVVREASAVSAPGAALLMLFTLAMMIRKRHRG